MTLASGVDPGDPGPTAQAEITLDLVARMLDHYGSTHGLRSARKHIAWCIDRLVADEAERKSVRRDLCTAESMAVIARGLRGVARAAAPNTEAVRKDLVA